MFPTLEDIKAVYPEYDEDWAKWVHENYHNESIHLVHRIFGNTASRLMEKFGRYMGEDNGLYVG